MQLRFASLAVINSREDFHLQECARAGRTIKKPAEAGFFSLYGSVSMTHLLIRRR